MARLRERRRLALEADPDGGVLRDASELLGPAVAETIGALGLGEQDAAVAQLARCYALAVDRARDPAAALRWLGPGLLACLMAIEATPASRKAETAAEAPSFLGDMRRARVKHKPV